MTEPASGTSTSGGDWSALVAVALLGTARKQLPDLQDAEVAALVRSLRPAGETDGTDGTGEPSTPPEVALLDRAAVLVGYRRGGVRPPPAPSELLEPAPAETLPLAPRAARSRLGELLAAPPGQEADSLLTEWLAVASRRGVRAPARLLPALLLAAVRRPDWRPAVRAVSGERGRWLADRLPDLGPVYAATGPDETAETAETAETEGMDQAAEQRQAWELGDDASRRSWLRAERERRPDEARALLEQAWRTEPAAQRAALLRELAAGLGPADEPLLEQALDDRSRDVRATAAQLLDRLPSSARALRMTGRALDLVRRRRQLLHSVLVVEPPPEPDSAALRDGIEKPTSRKAADGQGPAARRLQTIVGATPLDVWTDRLGLGITDLVRADVADGWGPTLHTGFALAAFAQQRGDWSRALLAGSASAAELTSLLLPVLPADERVGWATRLLPRLRGELRHLLNACPAPWPEPLTAAVINRLLDHPVREPLPTWQLRELIGFRVDPFSASLTAALRADARRPTSPAAARLLDQLAPLIAYRIALHEEFR